MAFRGQYEHSLDAKDRLTVPARWRGPLSDGIVLVAGLDPCVEVFSPQGYDDWTGASSPTSTGSAARAG